MFVLVSPSPGFTVIPSFPSRVIVVVFPSFSSLEIVFIFFKSLDNVTVNVLEALSDLTWIFPLALAKLSISLVPSPMIITLLPNVL